MVRIEILCKLSLDSDGGVRIRHIPDIATFGPKADTSNELFGLPAKPSGPQAIEVLKALPQWVLAQFREEVNQAVARHVSEAAVPKKT